MTETASGAGARKTRGDGLRVQRKGLTVDRVYTTPGVHPYDEVTWERRDVVQTNWKTGETIFEQKGVEFPDSWSANASTIVTTKYFRGALGTDVREWSLKQLLDRVVLTYTKAGKDNGYFATDADAEVFEHELTWMLAAPGLQLDGPVWFNVGTPPRSRSRRASSSPSTTRWTRSSTGTRRRGHLQGGSGAGLNLFRIRSSKELLSSGGTASGPVSSCARRRLRGDDQVGGATRRAAKMVVLDVDHPDIEEFIETRPRGDKIRALRTPGSTWTSAAATSPASSTRTRTTRSA